MMQVSIKKVALTFILTLGLSIALGFWVQHVLQRNVVKEYTTLSEISAYTKSLPEFPASDDNDWTDPQFQAFDKSRDLTTWQKIRLLFNIFQAPPWSPQYLARELKKLTNSNQEMGLVDGSNSFIHIKAPPSTRLLVFGDMHGAFHSLTRDLLHLQKLNLLNNELKLIPGIYIIFNGDFIDRSPYSIDSLILLATLMKQNKTQVFYIAGRHERASNWSDFGLKRELVARGYPYSDQPVPFKNEINEFFNTLPESIYISAQNPSHDVVRIAFHEHLELSYDEKMISPAFLEQKDPVKAYQFTTNNGTGPSIDVRAAIKTEEWRTANRIKHGIGLLDQDHGATTWASISSPITTHKTYLNVHDDSFIEIIIKDDIEKSLIFSHYQDPRGEDGFKKTAERSLVFGASPEKSLNRHSIKIASTMSLIRGVPTMGKQAKRGINLAINTFNLAPDEDDLNIRFYIDNDDYTPQNARRNILEYKEEGIGLFLLPTGTPTIMSYLDKIKKNEIAVFFPITGSAALRRADLTNIIHFRPTYEQEVKALIKTLAEEYGALKFAFLYQDDSYGRGPFEEAVKQLNAYGITEFTAMPYARGAVSFQSQVKQLKQSQADALGLFATATAAEEFIRQLGTDSLSNTQVFGISFVGELTLRRFANRLGINLMLASPVPNPKSFNEPIAINYRKAMDANNSDYDVFSFEAFIASSLLFQAIDSITEKNPSPSQVIKAVENFAPSNFMGFPLRFDPKTRSLASSVWIENSTKINWSKSSIY